MKRSELLTQLKDKLGKDVKLVKEFAKRSSSGHNRITLKFSFEEKMNAVRKKLGMTSPSRLEKRYGIGFHFFGNPKPSNESFRTLSGNVSMSDDDRIVGDMLGSR